ncbi:hypothetical protein FB451DRAFT_1498267 [Mycena latifolia]|nr:hypothetical protein FB451DRAFT_1498267 [Mycena latifolia]
MGFEGNSPFGTRDSDAKATPAILDVHRLLYDLAVLPPPDIPSTMTKSRVAKAAEWLRAAIRPPPRRQPVVTLWPPNPPPLPEDRIDIGQRPLEEQPPSCQFFRLPPELRQCIYELALGGRVVCLRLFQSNLVTGESHYAVRSAYYTPGDEASAYAYAPNRLDAAVEALPIALLSACRQVYVEALPILHGRNTFSCSVQDLEVVALAALGRYCLPNLRSVYLFHSYRRFRTPGWANIAAFIQQMRLETLAFEFEFDAVYLKFDEWHLALDRPVLAGSWSGEIVKICNLRHFDVFFTAGERPEYPTYRTEVAQRMRDLMIRPEADERYRVLLKEKPEAERLEAQL